MKRRWIYVLTPQHTGTWFALMFLKHHPQINGLTEINSIRGLIAGEKPREYKMGRGKEKHVEKIRTRNLIHSHIRAYPARKCLYDFQTALMIICNPPVITLRDPLATLLTMKHRWSKRKVRRKQPGPLELEHAMDVWRYLIAALKDIEGMVQPAYIPVDLLLDTDSRKAVLGQTLAKVGLKREPHATQWAEKWPLNYNASGEYESKIKYREGDVDYFLKAHNDIWVLLKQNEAALRPFLNQQGYKELIWFT